MDICQAGYPSAHPEEAAMVKALAAHARQRNFRIRVAALGRAFLADAEILVNTGIKDIHFHLHLSPHAPLQEAENLFSQLIPVIDHVRTARPDAVISLAVLDMGKPLESAGSRDSVSEQNRMVDILSLPDTSGIMAPNQVADRIQKPWPLPVTRPFPFIVTTIWAWHRPIPSWAFCRSADGGGIRSGIGERNGIGDLYLTSRILPTRVFSSASP